jgi:hypothetical protein
MLLRVQRRRQMERTTENMEAKQVLGFFCTQPSLNLISYETINKDKFRAVH